MTTPHNHNVLLLTGIILLSALIRIAGAFNWEGLTSDEVISLLAARLPLSDMWFYLKWEMHPPLYYLLLKGWIALFKDGVVALRLSSVLLGILSIYATYALAKKAFHSQKTGIYAALITSIASLALFNSLHIRMYGLLFLLTTLSTFLLLKVLSIQPIPHRRIMWVLYALTLLASLYTHLTALIIPIIHAGIVYYYCKKEKINYVKLWIISTTITLILYLPWFIHFLTVRLFTLQSNAWYFNVRTPGMILFEVIPKALLGNPPWPIMSLLLFLSVIVLSIRSCITIQRTEKNQWNIQTHITSGQVSALLLWLMPVIVLSVLELNVLRFYTIPLIGLLLITAEGLKRITVLPVSKPLMVVLLVALLLPAPLRTLHPQSVYWERVTQYIERNETFNDSIILGHWNESIIFNHYYRGMLPAYGIINIEQKTNDPLLTFFKENVQVTVTPHNINQLEEFTNGKNKIYFVLSDLVLPQSQLLFTQWFAEHEWVVTNTFNAGGYMNPRVLVYAKEISQEQ